MQTLQNLNLHIEGQNSGLPSTAPAAEAYLIMQGNIYVTWAVVRLVLMHVSSLYMTNEGRQSFANWPASLAKKYWPKAAVLDIQHETVSVETHADLRAILTMYQLPSGFCP